MLDRQADFCHLPINGSRGNAASWRCSSPPGGSQLRGRSVFHADRIPVLSFLWLCRGWTLSSRSHCMGCLQVLITLLFHLKGKVWFGGKGRTAAGAESDSQLSGPACALRGSEKAIIAKASLGLAAIFRRSDMSPWNHRKRGFSPKGHMEDSVLISKSHLLSEV